MKSNYFMIENLQDNNSFIVVDRVRKCIEVCENGSFKNITGNCEKIYEKDKRNNFVNCKRETYLLKALLEGEFQEENEVILGTNDRKTFDRKCLEKSIEQIQENLNIISETIENIKKGKEYKTYAPNDEYEVNNNSGQYNFYILKAINSNHYNVIDKIRKSVHYIEHGMYKNITKICEESYEKSLRKYEYYVGAVLFEILLGKHEPEKYDNILQTNNRREFDLKCSEIRKTQTEVFLENMLYQAKKLEEDRQYSTYQFSNIDEMFGESLSIKYLEKFEPLEENMHEENEEEESI